MPLDFCQLIFSLLLFYYFFFFFQSFFSLFKAHSWEKNKTRRDRNIDDLGWNRHPNSPQKQPYCKHKLTFHNRTSFLESTFFFFSFLFFFLCLMFVPEQAGSPGGGSPTAAVLCPQRHGSVSVQEDGGRTLHRADSRRRRAGHREPAAALVAHRPCLLLVDGLLIRLQHLLQRQFSGIGQVPRLHAVRGNGYPWVSILGGAVGGSCHGCSTVKPILHLFTAEAIDASTHSCPTSPLPPAQLRVINAAPWRRRRLKRYFRKDHFKVKARRTAMTNSRQNSSKSSPTRDHNKLVFCTVAISVIITALATIL